MSLRNKKKNQICAWLIIAAMLIGMLPTSVSAGALGAQMNGLNNYVVELSSDPSTSSTPLSFGEASDDGRIWADKSVSVNGMQFDVTLSALAQEYVRKSTNVVRQQAAADVALVIDLSSSMDAPRVTNMTNAVNKAIEKIMTANPENRIGLYYFSTVDNSGTLLPLASYSTTATGDGSDAANRYVSNSGTDFKRVKDVKQKLLNGTESTTTATTVKVAGGTATQYGLYTAINAVTSDINGRTKTSADAERLPYLLLFTDGEANRAYPNWYSDLTKSSDRGTEKSGSGSTGTADIAALTMLTAAKLKDQLSQAYQAYNGNTKDSVWFNIAFGPTEGNNLATALLKPTSVTSTSTGTLGTVLTSLDNYTNKSGTVPTAYKKYGPNGNPGYQYAKDYIYFVDLNDLTNLNKAFADLTGLVEAATQEKIIPFEQTNASGEPLNLVVTDVLGTGMELKTAPTMGAVTGTEKSSSGSVKTYGFTDLETTVEYNSATREVKWIIPPKEMPLITFSDRKSPTPGSYSNPDQLPVHLTYTVGLKDAYASATMYSGEYASEGVATTTTRFIPVEDNPYYYKGISTASGSLVSEPKEIGSDSDDITPFVSKLSNTTGTATASYAYEWDDNVFITKLGNNGKIAPKLKIEVAPASASVAAGDKATYVITVTNLTANNISNVIVNNTLPSGLTFVTGSMKEDSVAQSSGTFPYTINAVNAGGSVALTFEAAVPSGATSGTEYMNDVATITSVGGTSLSTPATVTSDKVTVAATFSPSVTVKLDGANYTGQSVTLWKDGVSKYTLTASGAVHSASGVMPGTYDIYVNGENTGVQLSGSDASKIINYYSVSFYDGAQKYDTPAVQTILSGGKAVLPTAPTKVGYTFDKWVTTDGGTTAFDFNTAITSTTSMYATWTLSTNTAYTVNHYQAALDGTYSAAPTVENLTGTTGGTTSAVAKTYPGFTAVAFTQGTIAADGSTVVNIYYTRNLYDITFVIDPIKGTTADDTAPEVVYGGMLTEPEIDDQPGYEFTGWDKTVASVTGDETYTAQFDLTDFSITYDLDGGSVATANPATYTIESADFTLNNPTKSGYTFSGWTGTGLTDSTTTVTIAQGSTGTRNYEAQWTLSTNTAYTVNHYQAALDGTYSAAPTVENLTGTTGGTTSAVAKTYPGFTAVAFTQGTIAADGSTVVNIYYTRNLYDITFVIDPIKGTTADDTAPEVVYGGMLTEPEIDDQPGYEFTGWDKTVASVTGDETYTAQFDLTDFSITYDLDGGSVATANPATYTVESADFTLNNPTKSGYTFSGWTGTGLTDSTTTVTIAQGSTGARNYAAQWTLSTNTAYTVNHYQAALDGTYSAAPTVENLTGTTGGTTSAVTQTYTGFTAVAFSQGTIAADGSTVVNIYYTRNLYDISFVIDPIKGTTADDTAPEVVYGASPTEPEIDEQPGYVFTGWDKTVVPVTGEETYTAQFDLTDFSITYDLDGGSVAAVNPTTYKVESTEITLNNPTKLGYTFSGWTGTGLTDSTTTVTIAQGSTGTRNYAAHWIPTSDIAYTVNHYQAALDGTYSAAPTVENLNGTSGDTTNAVAKTYPGFTAEAFTQGTIAADGSTVVHIYYTRNLYDITFVIDPIKGTAAGDTMQKIRYGATPTAPSIIGQPGYTFTGWDKTITPVTGNETYTAQFGLPDFTITYNLDHGTVNPSNPETYSFEDDDITLTNPTKPGYTFAGWTGTGLSEPTFTVNVAQGSTGDRFYIATWIANASIVTLDDNGGSGGSGSVTATYDQPMPTATAPSLAGYTFVGYYDQPSDGTKYYNADMSSAKDWDKTDSSVTLYAVWTEIGNVTIQYAANDTANGTVSSAYESLNPETGTAVGSVATAKPGYRFVEWQDANGVTVGTSAAFVPQQDAGSYLAATYTAVFATEVYTITYNLDGGTTASLNKATFTVADDAFTLTNPTKLGYTFTGWTGTGLSEPTLTVKVDKGSTGDRVYTATWQVVSTTGNYIVIGTVIDDDTPSNNLQGATVEIMKGNTQYGNTATTDADGKFTIEDVPAGVYDLRITLGEKTAIIAVIIGGPSQVVDLGKVIFPYNASSALKLQGSGTPPIVIDNLQPEAVDYLLNDYNNTGFAKIEMTIEKIDEATNDSDSLTAIGQIKTVALNNNLTIGIYLDMILEKFYRVTEGVNWNSEGLIGRTNGLIKVIIPIPTELQGKSGYTVYRYHGSAVNVISSVPNADGEYLTLDQSNWTLTLYAKNFSVYAIAYNSPQVQIPPVIVGTTNYAITFNGDGGSPSSTTQSVAMGDLLTKPADPVKDGYTFDGWYKADGSEWNFSTDKVYADVTLTAKWTVVKSDTNIPALDKVNHFAYMQGYPDKTFGPGKNMTRAEVTVMFARLLVEKMDVDKQYPSQFTDVNPAKWYANAIGYMEQFGIITGYSDGTFRPDAQITRAEFAAIASRFDELVTGESIIFSDVTDDYWAKDYITSAAAKGWIKGYPEGTFKPGNFITRAEVVSLVNRMLERYSDSSYVDNNTDLLNQYVDMTSTHWAYYDIMEATNSHDYEKNSDSETWVSDKK